MLVGRRPDHEQTDARNPRRRRAGERRRRKEDEGHGERGPEDPHAPDRGLAEHSGDLPPAVGRTQLDRLAT
jgi:hypothetical protein